MDKRRQYAQDPVLARREPVLARRDPKLQGVRHQEYVNQAEIDENRKKMFEREKKERDLRKLLTKDRTANPHLALISDHLWWLALGVKLGLIMMLISIILMLVSLG